MIRRKAFSRRVSEENSTLLTIPFTRNYGCAFFDLSCVLCSLLLRLLVLAPAPLALATACSTSSTGRRARRFSLAATSVFLARPTFSFFSVLLCAFHTRPSLHLPVLRVYCLCFVPPPFRPIEAHTVSSDGACHHCVSSCLQLIRALTLLDRIGFLMNVVNGLLSPCRPLRPPIFVIEKRYSNSLHVVLRCQRLG